MKKLIYIALVILSNSLLVAMDQPWFDRTWGILEVTEIKRVEQPKPLGPEVCDWPSDVDVSTRIISRKVSAIMDMFMRVPMSINLLSPITPQPILVPKGPVIEITSTTPQPIYLPQLAKVTNDLIQTKKKDNSMVSGGIKKPKKSFVPAKELIVPMEQLIDCSPKNSAARDLHAYIQKDWFETTYNMLRQNEKLREDYVLGRRLWEVLFKKITSEKQFYEGLDSATLPKNTRGIARAFAYLGFNNDFLGMNKYEMQRDICQDE